MIWASCRLGPPRDSRSDVGFPGDITLEISVTRNASNPPYPAEISILDDPRGCRHGGLLVDHLNDGVVTILDGPGGPPPRSMARASRGLMSNATLSGSIRRRSPPSKRKREDLKA
jgi:hypothetical protein